MPSAQTWAVDLDAPPSTPVYLLLPPCGAVRVRIHDSQGTAVEPMSTQLALASDFDEKSGGIAWGAAAFDPETFVEGVAHYPFVETGLEIVCEAIVGTTAPEVRGFGPTTVGDIVELNLDIGDPLIVLSGRLVDDRGTKVVDRAVTASFSGQGSAGSGSGAKPLRTDGAGRFEYVLSMRSAEGLRGTLTLSPIGAGSAEGTIARIELDSKLQPGRNDLGDVIAVAPQRLASGRIVDDRGAPIGKAALQVQSGNGSVWVTDVGLQLAYDESGAFEVSGATRAPQLRITATRDGHAPTLPIDVPVGSSGIEVVLERGATLVGRCLVDDPALLQRVRVRLRRPEDDPKWRQGPGIVTPRSDGTFELTRLHSGVVHLDVRDHETKEVLATIEDVRLAPGERAIDGRLDAIDLRGKLAPAAPK